MTAVCQPLNDQRARKGHGLRFFCRSPTSVAEGGTEMPHIPGRQQTAPKPTARWKGREGERGRIRHGKATTRHRRGQLYVVQADLSPAHTQTHTRRKNTQAPQKSQVGIHLLPRMEGLPSPVNLPAQVATLQDQKQGSTQHAAVSQLHKPTDPTTPLSRHDPEARSHSV